MAALAERMEAMTPAIEPAARGAPIDGEHLVHRLGAGVGELIAVDGGHGGESGEVVGVHGWAGSEEQGAGRRERKNRRAVEREMSRGVLKEGPTAGAWGDIGSSDRPGGEKEECGLVEAMGVPRVVFAGFGEAILWVVSCYLPNIYGSFVESAERGAAGENCVEVWQRGG